MSVRNPATVSHQPSEVKYNVATECTCFPLPASPADPPAAVPRLGLHSASASGDIDRVQYALSHGQPVNAVLDGVLPLHAAFAGGNVLVVNFLIEQGADVNAPRFACFPLLSYRSPVPRVPRRYSDRNRDTAGRIVGTTGSTPLHFAAANGHLPVVRTLLSRGAIPDRADKHGITPELIARQNGWIECAGVLAQATAAATPSIAQRGGASYPVDHPEASLRKRLHFKRSVDHTRATFDPEAKPPLASPGRPDYEKADLGETRESLQIQDDDPGTFICTRITVFRHPCTSEERTANLEKTVQELRTRLADSQQKAAQKEDSFNEIINSLGAKEESSSVSIASLIRVSLQFTSIRYRNHASQTNCPEAERDHHVTTCRPNDLKCVCWPHGSRIPN